MVGGGGDSAWQFAKEKNPSGPKENVDPKCGITWDYRTPLDQTRWTKSLESATPEGFLHLEEEAVEMARELRGSPPLRDCAACVFPHSLFTLACFAGAMDDWGGGDGGALPSSRVGTPPP